MRHIAHSHRSDPEMFVELFGPHTELSSAAAKFNFLGTPRPDWKVPGNEPLNTLITKFKDLVADQNPLTSGMNPHPPVYLTYESVVALFDEALAKNTWPVGDKALPFLLPSGKNSSQSDRSNRATGSKRVRDDADLDDPFAMPGPAPKRVQVLSPLRHEVGDAEGEADGEAGDEVDGEANDEADGEADSEADGTD